MKTQDEFLGLAFKNSKESYYKGAYEFYLLDILEVESFKDSVFADKNSIPYIITYNHLLFIKDDI